MEFLISTGILIVVCVLGIAVFKKGKAKKKAVQRLCVIEIPNDAHDAVAGFARLCSLTRNKLKTMSVLRDEHASMAAVRFTYGTSDMDSQAEMSFSAGCALDNSFFEHLGYALEEGIQVTEDHRVAYFSSSIHGLKAWGNMSDGYSEDAAQWLRKLIILAFTNECPDAYADAEVYDENGLAISFRFG